MDKNKLSELRSLGQGSGYKIPKTCGLCRHGVFVGINEWGGCAVRTYDHLKHNEAKRQLSIYKGGSCPDLFEPKEQIQNILGAYYEFLT